MVEKHEKSRSWVAPFRTVAYVLFYIGLVIHLRASHNPSLFKVARYENDCTVASLALASGFA